MSKFTIASKISKEADFVFDKKGYVVFGEYKPEGGIKALFPIEMLTRSDKVYMELQIMDKANHVASLDELEDPEEYVPDIKGMEKALKVIKKNREEQ